MSSESELQRSRTSNGTTLPLKHCFHLEKTLRCLRCIWFFFPRSQVSQVSHVSQGAMLLSVDRSLQHRTDHHYVNQSIEIHEHIIGYCGHFWGPDPSGDLMKWLLNDLQRHQTLHFSNSQDRVAFGRKLQYNGWRCTCKMSLRVWKICSPQNTTIKQAWDAFQLLIKCDNIEMHLGNWLISILSYIKPTIHRTRMG